MVSLVLLVTVGTLGIVPMTVGTLGIGMCEGVGE